MLHKLPRLFRFQLSQCGASLVEFVLVFPILAMIIFTTIELGIMLAITVNLESCVMAGAYYGQSGSFTTGSTPTASALAIMQSNAVGFLNTTNLTFTIQSFSTFAAASSGGAGTSGTGNPGQVGMYQATYKYSPITPLVAATFGTTVTLQATSYTKNQETFSS